jgi:hypothetical protein
MATPGTGIGGVTHERATRKGPMERAIETMATGLGNAVGFAADHGILFAVFAILWVAFGIGLAVSQDSIHGAWDTIRGLPWFVQGLVWILFLPVLAGLWIWETTWPFVVRLILVLGLAGWNLLVLLPRALTARP